MLRKVLAAALLVVAAVAGAAGQDTLRTFKFKAIDGRGHPVRHAHVVFRLSGEGEMQSIGRRGVSIVEGVRGSDTLFFFAEGVVGAIPLVGLDSAAVLLKKPLRALPDNRKLNIGYQVVDARNNTGAVGHVDMRQVSTLGYNDLGAFLQGRLAGVYVRQSRSGTEIIIRGESSLLLSSAALIVVDGVVMDSFDAANHLVNIHDIETVDVLKDGSIYGSRGANGVVIITTKRGTFQR